MVSYQGAHTGAPLHHKGCHCNEILTFARTITNRSEATLHFPFSIFHFPLSKKEGSPAQRSLLSKTLNFV
jgi:hypothetical protein